MPVAAVSHGSWRSLRGSPGPAELGLGWMLISQSQLSKLVILPPTPLTQETSDRLTMTTWSRMTAEAANRWLGQPRLAWPAAYGRARGPGAGARVHVVIFGGLSHGARQVYSQPAIKGASAV